MFPPLPRITIAPVAAALLAACAGSDRATLSELHDVEPEMSEVRIEEGLDRAMEAYRSYLATAPESARTPEAMRRLADLQLEKDFGIQGDGGADAMPAPEPSAAPAREERYESVPAKAAPPGWSRASQKGTKKESDAQFEARATAAPPQPPASRARGARQQDELLDPKGEKVEWSGPEEAIELYDEILATYPHYEHNDRVLYQKARAYDELGRNDEAIAVMAELVQRFPASRFVDEVQFRRGEYFFMRRRFLDAEDAYGAVTAIGAVSPYYELALYKLGWTFYKQELHEEALERYIALLDYKVSTGYDFDQTENEDEERRVADTYRVISLSFSSLGGPKAITDWFARHGARSYEARIYARLGEFYLEKLRYYDAAESYKAFVRLHPLHPRAPHFQMRVVEIYEAGGFPKLVLESKKEFAAAYGLRADYWQHFRAEEAPEVLAFLKTNLEDLATHYHSVYQDKETRRSERPAHFEEALHWYQAYLESFPEDAEAPGLHYRMADLLLEHQELGRAAREYERTAYEYPEHEQSAAAGYAAIYAHRQHQKAVSAGREPQVREAAVTSTLRFVERFPAHEHAATVLGAAVDDLYGMRRYEQAIEQGKRLVADWPESDAKVRRAAFAVVGHASFDLELFPEAESAYATVLEMTPPEDESRQEVVETLAASIYKQGEAANAAGEYRVAADHFLRIAAAAPGSEIRPVAEYDAGAALIRLEDWVAAAEVLEAFRKDHPDHELQREATRQIARVYRERGELARAAEEYERVAREAESRDLRREAELLAGELYEEAGLPDRALALYLAHVKAFPKPLEGAVELRFKISELYQKKGDEKARRDQLQRIVDSDRRAGAERTDRVRFLAAVSALALTQPLYDRFVAVELVQPFEKSLKKKQKRLEKALAGFEALVDYEVGEATAGATFFIAELYRNFSDSLMASERPKGLSESEKLDYELVLEEEAFPFEERSIEIHEKNLELMGTGVYNRWIERSLSELAVLMPGRYAKFEWSSGWIDSLERYAYRSPAQSEVAPAEPEATPAAEPAEDAPAADAPSQEARVPSRVRPG